MKRFQYQFIAATVLAMSLSACSTAPKDVVPLANEQNASDNTSEYELVNRVEVVATVRSRDVAIDLERQALEWGYTLKKQEKLAGLDLYLLTFDCPPGVDPRDASRELERLQPKSSVGEKHKYWLSSSPTSLSAVKAPKTYADAMLQWPHTACDSKMKIGIIDGGLTDVFKAGSKAKISDRSFIDGAPSNIALMHGSSIAAILTDRKRLKNVELYSAAVTRQDENGNNFSDPTAILKALDWMIINDVAVVNVSLSGPPNKVLEAAFNAASEKNLIVVAAVGNQGQNSRPQFPAAYANVLAATAIDIEGDIYSKAVRGDHVDFAAPGVDVYVDTMDQEKYISGTSIAAPFITAAIAASSNFTDDTSRQNIIQYFSASAKDLGPKGKDKTYGLGLINAKDICS